MKRASFSSAEQLNPFLVRLYEELDVPLAAAVVHSGKAVGEEPHLHGPVGAAGEDVVGRSHLDLHHARPEVPEQRLASVFVGKRVEETLRGDAPHLSRGKSGKTMEQIYFVLNKEAFSLFSSLTVTMKAERGSCSFLQVDLVCQLKTPPPIKESSQLLFVQPLINDALLFLAVPAA